MELNKTLLAALVAPWLLAASLPASAIIKWDSGNCTSSFQSTCGDANPVPAGSPTVTYSSISDTGAGATLASAYVVAYGTHLGITSRAGSNAAANGTAPYDSTENAPGAQETTTSPQHAMDNNGNSEFFLLSFSSSVSLSQVELGWSDTDSDITVLAYKPTSGPANPTLALTNGSTTYSLLTGLGWKLIGNYANVCSPNSCAVAPDSVAINGGATPVSSSYWLIGAYNSTNFGTASDPNSSTSSLGTGNDYVKLLTVSGISQPNTPPSSVPEPSSLWLAGLAMLGLTRARRRRAAQ
ncbi:MAG: exosortase-dependent surface protein XDP1 [Betaproteobacteria bacterium]